MNSIRKKIYLDFTQYAHLSSLLTSKINIGVISLTVTDDLNKKLTEKRPYKALFDT